MKASYDEQVLNEDDGSDDDFTSMGFMFEGAEPTKEQIFEFAMKRQSEESHREEDADRQTASFCRAVIEHVDDVAGAVQSGHYLWPAANFLAQHLVDHHQDITHQCALYSDIVCKDTATMEGYRIIELGAGCGLAGLIALQVFDVECFVFTDHDPGTLQRARDNYYSTMKAFNSETCFGIGPKQTPKQLCSNVHFEPLHWGDEEEDMVVLRKLVVMANGSYDIVIGSDLIYCKDVVRPLLITANHLLFGNSAQHGIFLLTQSFPFDDDTEDEIDKVCLELKLSRKIISDSLGTTLDGDSGARVQTFTSHRI